MVEATDTFPEFLTIQAAAEPEWGEIEAADAGKPKLATFKMVAYTGGPMNVAGFYRPVIVDLAGVTPAAKQIPNLLNHDFNKIVGHGEAEISPKQITASGVVSAENDFSREVVASSRNGFPWQASIGLSVQEFESVKADTKAAVNGRTVKGPILVARKSTLNEISFVPLGADKRTSAKVAAGEPGTTDRPAGPAGIRISRGTQGLWLEGSGTSFVSIPELERYLEQLRTH